jgi:drug/metabolite transporter (DMT)-like permease
VSRDAVAVVAMLFTMMVWGLSPVFIRVLSVDLGPADALVIRYGAVAPIFAGVLALRGGWRIDRGDWGALLLVSLVGMLGYNIGSAYGFQLVPAGIGGLVIATQPLLIVLFAALAGREPLVPAAIVGLITAFCGTVILFWKDLTFVSDGGSIPWGACLIFLSGCAWAFYVVTAKPLIQKYGSLPVSGMSILIATVPMLFLASPGTLGTLGAMTPAHWGAMTFMVIVSTFMASITWNYGAARLSAAVAGAFLYLVPMIAVAAGAVFLAEPVSGNVVLGGLLILAGVGIAQFGGRWRMARLRRM